jgi:hypothetical protein
MAGTATVQSSQASTPRLWLTVGFGFGADGFKVALPLTIGIGLQDAPEGLAVAVALIGLGYACRYAFAVATLTGMIEPIGGVLGALIMSVSQMLLRWELAFAAGAMLYAISHEIIAKSHRCAHQQRLTAGLAFGPVLMLFLDVAWLIGDGGRGARRASVPGIRPCARGRPGGLPGARVFSSRRCAGVLARRRGQSRFPPRRASGRPGAFLVRV